MRNNILGGLVIFFVVVTCLLLLDDITNPSKTKTTIETTEVDQKEKQSDLAVVESQD